MIPRSDLFPLAIVSAVALAAGTPVSAAEWVPGPDFPTSGVARSHAAAVEVGGTIWALGGTPFDSGDNGATHSLAPAGTDWTVEPSQEGPILWHGAGVDALGRIVVFGGESPDGQEGNDYAYNPLEGPEDGLSHRSEAAPLARFAWTTDAEGRIYSIGGGPGVDANAGDPNVGQTERYLAQTDTWEVVAPVPYGLAEAAATYDGEGHILVFGGFDSEATTRLTTVARFDIADGTWSTDAYPDLPIGLTGHCAVLGADGRVYVLGGVSGPPDAGVAESRVWVLHLGSGTWIEGPTMQNTRAHFGAVLGPDDHIYALGGDETATVEKIYTPPCPTFLPLPPTRSVWSGQTLVLEQQVSGGTPIAFRWTKDGNDLYDGPSDGGGTISGAATETLVITGMAPADAGSYALVAVNACGAETSPATSIEVEFPPEISGTWQATALHPGWAVSSRAYDTGNGEQVGFAMVQADELQEHAVLWTGDAASAVDLHVPDTIKTGAVAVGGGTQGGNWYQPFEILHNGEWFIVYYPEACVWTGSAGSHVNLKVSGWEYSSLGDTDGIHQVGTISRDDEVGNVYARAGMWSGTPGSWVSLHPASGVSNSYGAAIDGGRQFGSILTPYPGPIRKAAMWSGTASSYRDLHPNGASRSWISAAGDGLQIGTAEFGGVLHPMIWSGHRLSVVDFLAGDGTVAGLEDVDGGLQVGAVTVDGRSHAVVWAGDPDVRVDLHAALPPEYGSSRAYGVDVGEDGTISIAGSAFNESLAREEAILWVSGGTSSVDAIPGSTGSHGLRLELGPNPATASTSLGLELATPGAVEVRVFDASGRQRGSLASMGLEPGQRRLPLASLLDPLPTGAYFIRVRTPDGKVGRASVRVIR